MSEPRGERKRPPDAALREAPFVIGPYRIDTGVAAGLLDLALERGGDFADLFFEYRRAASLSMEDGRIRAAGGGVDLGVGIRVVARLRTVFSSSCPA